MLHSNEMDELHLPSKSKVSDVELPDSPVTNTEKSEESPAHTLDEQSVRSEDQGSVSEISIDVRTNSGFSDLDILPTKDYPERSKPIFFNYLLNLFLKESLILF